MTDTYQAIYDAVRSKLGNGDIGAAVETAARDAFSMANHHIACVAQEFALAAHEYQRPSVLMRPALNIDGNQWCALYGNNLQDGIAGFGDSPAAAMADFDKEWATKRQIAPMTTQKPPR